MPWIDDVVSHTTIRSVWGNNIRNHVVHGFASKAERDAQAVPQEGMFAHTFDTHITYVRVGGAWWVVAMPWRAYTPTVWASPVSNAAAKSQLGSVTGGPLYWRQAMGSAEVIGNVNADMAQFNNIDAAMYLSTPVTLSVGGGVGAIKATVYGRGNVHGGWAEWSDNNAGVSRVVVMNVGPGVTPTSVINVPTGNTIVNLQAELRFVCDPAYDTP